MKLIIPLAGKDPQYNTFKPFIKVKGKTIIEHILDQHPIKQRSSTIFILLKELDDEYHIASTLRTLFGEDIIIRILDKPTQGAPCTIIEGAGDLIDTSEDILIELADVLRDISTLYKDITTNNQSTAGIIPIQTNTRMNDRPWGYIYTDTNNQIKELKEKEMNPQAENATMGLYYFSHGSDFIEATKQMIQQKSFTYHGAFFVGPVYNEMIKNQKKVILSQNRIQKILGNISDIQSFK